MGLWRKLLRIMSIILVVWWRNALIFGRWIYNKRILTWRRVNLAMVSRTTSGQNPLSFPHKDLFLFLQQLNLALSLFLLVLFFHLQIIVDKLLLLHDPFLLSFLFLFILYFWRRWNIWQLLLNWNWFLPLYWPISLYLCIFSNFFVR